MVKNIKRGIAVIIIFCSAVLAYIAFPWAGMFLGIVLMPNPPKPEITYGEFPCKLVYETDGETKVIEDTVICEFDGFENFGTAGKDRKWKTTLKSGNENLTLLNMRSSNETNELGQPILELYFYYGNAAYYMGDDTYSHSAQDLDKISYEFQTADGKIGHSSYKAEEAYEKFNIRLISWEVSDPIENKFSRYLGLF